MWCGVQGLGRSNLGMRVFARQFGGKRAARFPPSFRGCGKEVEIESIQEKIARAADTGHSK